MKLDIRHDEIRSGEKVLSPTKIAVVGSRAAPAHVPLLNAVAQDRTIQLDFLVSYSGRTALAEKLTFDRRVDYKVLRKSSNPMAIWRFLSQQRPHVLVIAGYYLPLLQTAIAWAHWRRTPYVFWIESHLHKHRAFLKRAVKRMLLPYILKGASSYIAVSSMAKDYLAYYGVRRKQIFVVPHLSPNAIQTQSLRRSKGDLRRAMGFPDMPTILWVGRIISLKRLDTLVSALTSLPERIRYQLVIVGEGPDQARIETLCTELELRDVHFVGPKTQQELRRYYSCADTFVLPSSDETFSAVIPEAMAHGLPIITTTVVGCNADFVFDGKNGFVVPPYDVSALADSLCRMLEGNELRKTMSNKSLEIMQRHSSERNAKIFVQAIDYAMRTKRKRH